MCALQRSINEHIIKCMIHKDHSSNGICVSGQQQLYIRIGSDTNAMLLYRSVSNIEVKTPLLVVERQFNGEVVLVLKTGDHLRAHVDK